MSAKTRAADAAGAFGSRHVGAVPHRQALRVRAAGPR